MNRTRLTRLIRMRPVFRQGEPGEWPRDEAALLLSRAHLARVEQLRAAAGGSAEAAVSPADVCPELAHYKGQLGSLLDAVTARPPRADWVESFGGWDFGISDGAVLRVVFEEPAFFDNQPPVSMSVTFRAPSQVQLHRYKYAFDRRSGFSYRLRLTALYEDLRVDSWNEPPAGAPIARFQFRERALNMFFHALFCADMEEYEGGN